LFKCGEAAMQQTQAVRPLISLCMIVKDEEQNLPRLLKSAAPHVDEIVVVDTGSSDGTVQIAASYGARVFHHPWEGDFAKHRNQSISYASGQWILIMDADEELLAGTAPLMRQALAHIPNEVGCIYFEMYNEAPGGLGTTVLHPRLFRNDGFFHYEGKVHNKPMHQGKTAKSPIRMVHYGYNLKPEAMEAKYRRRIEMIGQWLKSEPDNYAARTYMAQALMERPATRADSLAHGLKALELARAQQAAPEQLCTIYYPIMATLHFLARYDEAEKHCRDCLAIAPQYPDPYFFLTNIYLTQGRWRAVCRAARSFMQLQTQAASQSGSLGYIENMTLNQAPVVLYQWFQAGWELGSQPEAEQALGILLGHPQGEAEVKRALKYVLGKGQTRRAAQLAGEILRQKPAWGWAREITEAGS
jgi:glycosyltransferase involved in cell wall biosynthesis